MARTNYKCHVPQLRGGNKGQMGDKQDIPEIPCVHTTPSGQPLLSYPEQAELCDVAEGEEAPESHAGRCSGPSAPSPCPYGALNSPLPAVAGTGTDLEAVQEAQLMAGCSSILLWRGTGSQKHGSL